MKLKKSQFTYTFERNGNFYCVQTSSRAIMKYPLEFKANINRVLMNPSSEQDYIEKEIRKKFIENYILVPSHLDELCELRKRFTLMTETKSAIGLSILPTTECNFACQYCYEKLKPESMGELVVDNIVRYIYSKKDNLKKLDINWFGGEPTLRIDIIEALSRRILSICELNNIQYSASIVSNGSLLNKKTVAILKNMSVTKVQLTIDGCEKSHNLRRPFKSGKGSYQTIISNLPIIIDNFDKIVLRINVDTQKIKEIDPLLKKLEPWKNKVTVFPMPINLHDKASFSKEDILNRMTAREVITTLSSLKWLPYKNFFLNFSHMCQAYYNNHILVMPNGDLYRCSTRIGQKEFSCGNIIEYLQRDILSKQTYNFDPFENAQCCECIILPFCLGGCQNAAPPGPENLIRCWLRENIDELILSVFPNK